MKLQSHRLLLQVQRLNRYIHSEDFARHCETFTFDEWILINSCIEHLDVEELRRVCNNRTKKTLDTLSLARLRLEAKQLGIQYYTNYNKENLILQIITVRDKLCLLN